MSGTQLRRRAASLFAAVVLALAMGEAAGAAPVNGLSWLKSSIPAVLLDEHFNVNDFRTATPRAISDAEYRRLARANAAPLHGINGVKYSVVADRKGRTILVQRFCCGFIEWILSTATTLPENTVQQDLSDVSVSAIRLGSSMQSALREFGPARLIAVKGANVLRYRHRRNHDCSTLFTFDINHGRVQAMSILNTC